MHLNTVRDQYFEAMVADRGDDSRLRQALGLQTLWRIPVHQGDPGFGSRPLGSRIRTRPGWEPRMPVQGRMRISFGNRQNFSIDLTSPPTSRLYELIFGHSKGMTEIIRQISTRSRIPSNCRFTHYRRYHPRYPQGNTLHLSKYTLCPSTWRLPVHRP
jgi:hypothetical protein